MIEAGQVVGAGLCDLRPSVFIALYNQANIKPKSIQVLSFTITFTVSLQKSFIQVGQDVYIDHIIECAILDAISYLILDNSEL